MATLLRSITPSLLMKFAIASAMPIIVLAFGLSQLIENRIEERTLESAADATQLVATLGIQPHITELDLAEGLNPDELERIDERLRAGLLGKKVVRIKIWNKDGRIVYSEDESLIGKRFPVESDLGEALEGELEAEVSELDGVEEASERGLGRLFEVYVPLRFYEGGEVAGAFEMYLPYAPIEEAINRDVRRLQLWMLLGLTILYLVLYRIVAGASKQLREQADELRRRADENEFLALHDALTELPNRRLLHDRLNQAIKTAERDESLVAVMLMDLDRFKEINDTLGHHNGDLILKDLSRRLKSVLRGHDSIARLGGDEFAILVANITHREVIADVAGRIQSSLDESFELEGLDLAVSASIGISIYPDHGRDAFDLMQRADVAMYVAKQSHSPCAVYDPATDGYSPGRLALIGEFRRAIDSSELALHYQPKIELGSGRVTGVEALARWEHSERGMVPPDEFVSLAEHTGLIKALSAHVLDMAISQQKQWSTAGLDVDVAVNLSVKNLLDDSLPDDVANLLAKWSVPASMLTLEITESSIMADPPRTAEVLMRLSRMGVTISVDDFGTGYSSLSYLKQLPVSEIKIDRSFVKDMDSDENDSVIVRSTIDLGRNLGLKVVAEGVEDALTCGTLADLGCDVGQGYFIGRPMPPDSMTAWLIERKHRLEQNPLTAPGV
ncbi:MAG: putative bifunctional diguanylate cyclase/phosphodiesterase [Actinomycetota bacterium]